MAKASPRVATARRTKPSTDGPKERLLAAAHELFYRRGIRNVGIDEIIAKAGVAKASLYTHFASKDDLIAEYVRGRGAQWWSWFREAVEARASDPGERLLAAFDVLGEWTADAEFRGCALQNAAIELANPGHAGHQSAVSGKRGVRDYLVSLAGDAGYENPKALGEQLALLFEGAIITGVLESSSAPAHAARHAAAVLLSHS